MAFRWACARCGQLHGRNPSKCVNCSHTVLTPVSREKVERHEMDTPRKEDRWEPSEAAEAAARQKGSRTPSSSRDEWGGNRYTPTAIDPDEIVTYGATPEPDFPSSPDVAPDGSIGSEETATSSDEVGRYSRTEGFSPFVIIGAVVLLALLLLVFVVSL